MQAIAIIVTLAIAKQITKWIDRIRCVGLKIALELLLRIAIVGLSIYLKMGLMIFINSLILFVEVIGGKLLLKELEKKQKQAEEEKQRDGVVYTLTESEYKIID